MARVFKGVLTVGLVVLLLAGCARNKPTFEQALGSSGKAAWSLKGASEDFAIVVSEAGKTLKMVPRVGRVVATTVDAVVNDKYRILFDEALGDYSLTDTFVQCMSIALDDASGGRLTRVAPMGTWAGYNNRREAEADRLQGLSKNGYDLILDLDADYALKGADFVMECGLYGRALTIPKGNTLWRETLTLRPGPLYADAEFESIIEKSLAGLTDPQMTVEKDRAERLAANNAELLRTRFEETSDELAAALVCALDLKDDARGRHALGRSAFWNKKFEDAKVHFEKSLAFQGGQAVVMSDLAVVCAQLGDISTAIRTAETALHSDPYCAAAHFNLAWWYAFGKNDHAAANEHYAKAKELGAEPRSSLDEFLAGTPSDQ
jgi:tetratricopeptide (TPR) repeat protein